MPVPRPNGADGLLAQDEAALDVLLELGVAARDGRRRIADVGGRASHAGRTTTAPDRLVVHVAVEDVEGLEPAGFDVVHCSWVLHGVADAQPALRATPSDRRGVRAFPLSVGILAVVAAEQLSPNMRRVVLTGEGIAELPVEEPGEILTLIWPAGGSDTIVLPTLRRWRFWDGAEEQHARNLTIRALDRARGRVTIDFFLHGDDGQASRWARAATVGDAVGYGGPRVHWRTDPAADWTLLIGDETGLPAIGAIAEQRPAGHQTIAVVEVESAAEEQVLTSSGDLEVHWVHRGTRAPGCGTGLLDTVRAVDLPTEGHPQVWAAGVTADALDPRAPARRARPSPQVHERARLLEASRDRAGSLSAGHPRARCDARERTCRVIATCRPSRPVRAPPDRARRGC